MIRRIGIVGVLLILAAPLLSTAGLAPLTKRPGQVSEQDWQNARGMRMGDKDLRLAEGGHYIGGIDRIWWLVMTGPPTSKFHYHFAMLPGTGVEVQGTYEVKDGLAWFSGMMKGDPNVNLGAKQVDRITPVRFALNYKILDGKPTFNLLTKDDKGNYQYERRWFWPNVKEWLPREQHKITFVPRENTDKKLSFLVKAELTRWDMAGKKPEKHFFEVTATYTHNQTHWYRAPKQPGWLPVWLKASDGKTGKDLPPCFHLQQGHFGDVRGFTFSDPPEWGNQ